MNLRLTNCSHCGGSGEDPKLSSATDAKKPLCSECKGVGKIPLVEHLLSEVLAQLKILNTHMGKFRGR